MNISKPITYNAYYCYHNINKRRNNKFIIIIICILLTISIIVLLGINLETVHTFTIQSKQIYDTIHEYNSEQSLLLLDSNVDLNTNNVHNNTSSTLSSSSTNKRTLFLHVGPPKTGSTTLQCTLESYRLQLKQDNISYIGRPENCPPSVVIGRNIQHEFNIFTKALVTDFSCHVQLLQWEKEYNNNHNHNTSIDDINHNNNIISSLPSCWEPFISRLQYYKQNNQNVIFSDEAMSNSLARTKEYRPGLRYPWIALKLLLKSMGWDVRILIVHRPLFDYLPSVYVEKYKYGPGKIRLRRWFGNGLCPNYNGKQIPKPFDYPSYDITIQGLLEKDQILYPTPAQIYELFQQHGYSNDQIYLVDMMKRIIHKQSGLEQDFIQYIICEIFPETIHTCNELVNNKIRLDKKDQSRSSTTSSTSPQLNPSLSLHYDLIAVEACQLGILNGTIVSRGIAQTAIQYHQEVDLNLTSIDFPLICPSDEKLHEIFNVSLIHEQRLRQNRDNEVMNANEKNYDDYFWNIVVKKKKKFCTVDSKMVVEDPKWIEYFAALNDREHKRGSE